MPVQIGAKPQASFDQPVELLMDCHRRIERFLAILLRVVDDVRGGALGAEHREALDTALNYFHAAAPRHTEDEERSLFPRMRGSDDAAVRAALAKLDALEADHRAAEVAHARVETLGRRWLADNRLPDPDVAELRRLLTDLSDTYRRHIRVEDEEVFPLAARTLSADQLTAVGREMEHRRRQDPGRPQSRCAQRRLSAR